MSALCVIAIYFSSLVFVTSPLPASLPRECIPGICPEVDSDDWTRLQSRCCTDQHVYHCQVGHDAHVRAVCAKVRHCDASQAVVVTSIGVECRQCLRGVSHQVPSPSYYHTRLSMECETVGGKGDPTQGRHHMEHEDSHISGRPHPNSKPFHKGPRTRNQVAKNSYSQLHAKLQAQKEPSANTMASEIPPPDSSSKTDQSEPIWSIVLIAVAMAALTLIILGIMVFFVIKYFARRVNRVYSIGGRLSSEIQYKHI